MQKEAARQEALSVKDTEASTAEPASAGAVAAEGSAEAEAAAEPAGAVTPAGQPRTAGTDSGGAAAGPGEQRERVGGAADTADGADAAELEEEVKALRKVVADLAERAQELQALQEQVRQRPDTCACGTCANAEVDPAGAAPLRACAHPALVCLAPCAPCDPSVRLADAARPCPFQLHPMYRILGPLCSLHGFRHQGHKRPGC